MKVRVVAAALIFLALSIVRVAFPQSVAVAVEALSPALQYGQALASDILDAGKRLSGKGNAVYAWEKDEPSETDGTQVSRLDLEGFDLEEMIHANLTGLAGYENAFIPPETEGTLHSEPTEPEPEIEPEPDPEEEAAAAAFSALQTQIEGFLTAQAAVTNLALPETVSTEAVLLDFEYTRPAAVDYTSAFGYRVHPIYGDMRFHYGTDFPAYSGEQISAFADGTVIAAQQFDGYGQTVIIDHGNGFTSLYAHCSVINVTFGDTVTKGQTIALVGQTGNVTGPHLHFELQKDGKYLNPEFYL